MNWIKAKRLVVKGTAVLLGIVGGIALARLLYWIEECRCSLSTERTNMKKFWMVYVEGTSGPVIKHESLILAKEETEKLVLKTGRTVYVLAATLLAKPSRVEFELLEE